eukprot:CAMPEP_0176486440 /NCGR_PEP_ID=MMETSP0200_2-20121128/5568_1 /TAXON_ID=947934 /ORGANISM="Chaetoceros sp., Strain GSL56" /LENGTH=546 /DNA_ID=CAMNT_0017883139 /DNA_START=222 /DNA_END=1862 /DNA_ORIENTATION=-
MDWKGDNPEGFVHFVSTSSKINHSLLLEDVSNCSSYPSDEQRSIPPFTIDHSLTMSSAVISRDKIEDAPKELSNINYRNATDIAKIEFHHANYDSRPSSRQKETSFQHLLKIDARNHTISDENSENEEFVKDSLSSIVDKGICHPPLLVPVEINDIVDCSAASLSDISESESIDNKHFRGDTNDFVPLAKKLKVDHFDYTLDCCKKTRFNSPLQSVRDNQATSNDVDLSEVCERFGDWSPFVKKVSEFMEAEQLPFDYFDVWALSTYDAIEQVASCTANNETSNTCLRYVGHSPRNSGSIWTLYHMNEFGKHSSKYKFHPGVGLPGKVFASGKPLWYDCIQQLPSEMFLRVEAAKKHGIRKGLGIPIFHTPLGKIVVAMYTCEGAIQDCLQQIVLQKCCNFFHIANVLSPKWQLVIDVGGDAGNSDIESDFRCIDQQEQAIATLLTEYSSSTKGKNSAPSDDNEKKLLLMDQSYLRLLLLQPSYKRTQAQNDSIGALKKYYRKLFDDGHNESDIVRLLLHEWATNCLAVVETAANKSEGMYLLYAA